MPFPLFAISMKRWESACSSLLALPLAWRNLLDHILMTVGVKQALEISFLVSSTVRLLLFRNSCENYTTVTSMLDDVSTCSFLPMELLAPSPNS